jgi:hypothetical protein
MKGGDTHKVGVNSMDHHKTGPCQIEGPVSGGKANPVYSGSLFVQAAHGFDKFLYRAQGAAAEMAQQKTQCPDPKGHKVQVYIHFSGCKRDLLVQGMIGPYHRVTAFKKSSLVLEEEEIFDYGNNA